MTKTIDSDALELVNTALGLTGAGAPVTELQDGVVDQVIDVGRIARRSRTLRPNDGIFIGIMRNVHAGSGSLINTSDPYDLAPALVISPYPAPVPKQFDLWLLGASVTFVSGTGTLTAALTMTYRAAQQGWGETNGNAFVIGSTEVPVAHWDSVITEGAIVFAGLSGDRGPHAQIGMRLPRSVDTALRFRSTASAVASFDLQLVLGMFPASLGQDGSV